MVLNHHSVQLGANNEWTMKLKAYLLLFYRSNLYRKQSVLFLRNCEHTELCEEGYNETVKVERGECAWDGPLGSVDNEDSNPGSDQNLNAG